MPGSHNELKGLEEMNEFEKARRSAGETRQQQVEENSAREVEEEKEHSQLLELKRTEQTIQE